MRWSLLCLAIAGTAHAQEFDLASALQEGPPMTADRAAELARRASPSVDRARALERMADAAVARSRAALLPRLDLTARYAHVDGFPDGQIGMTATPEQIAAARMLAEQVSDPASRALWLNSIDQQSGGISFAFPRDQYSFGARLTWPASDMFFALLPALEAAEASARARALMSEASLADVDRSARDAFYQLARARGAHAVARQSLIHAQTQLERIDANVRAGYLTAADSLAAQARLAAAEQAIAQTEMGVEITDAALRALIDQPDGPVYGIAEPILDADGEDLAPFASLAERAVDRRPELRAMRESIASLRAAGRASDASGYPHLALYAAGEVSAPNRYVIPPSGDPQPAWEIGVTFSYAPNDTLAAVHRGEELAAQAESVEAELAQLTRAVRLEVRRAHASVRASARSLEAARAALTAAEAAHESRDAQLTAGQATSADVIAAQNDLDRARLAVIDAAIQLRASRAQLDYAVGR
jgi:outer membrane protein